MRGYSQPQKLASIVQGWKTFLRNHTDGIASMDLGMLILQTRFGALRESMASYSNSATAETKSSGPRNDALQACFSV